MQICIPNAKLQKRPLLIPEMVLGVKTGKALKQLSSTSHRYLCTSRDLSSLAHELNCTPDTCPGSQCREEGGQQDEQSWKQNH